MGLQLIAGPSGVTERAAELLTYTLLRVFFVVEVLVVDLALHACEKGLAKNVFEVSIRVFLRIVVCSAVRA